MPDTSSRLFIAVELEIHVVEKLIALQNELKSLVENRHAVIRLTPPEQVHLTLKFLGDCDTEFRDALSEILKDFASCRRAFTLECKRLDAFPSPDTPRVVVTDIGKGREELLSLVRDLENELDRKLFFPKDKRPFRPHVTLGRIKTPTDAISLLDAVEHLRNNTYGLSFIREIILFESLLLPRGAVHRVVTRAILGDR